ncbi:hypothetical protein [Tunicatimonas pelagia]|uniref:hypothetical protein n=1 Tax=Tunicatimonas pelagia TaxID=931531 RepID=UPI0026659190|nr:hypothetical protein [Tunicatimonas pelagia]WKN42539.1 hypothetical protein P0M28_26235 [Tunicatimonas pelagia]
MHLLKITRWLLIASFFWVSACQSANVGRASENFQDFYQRFLTDSTFQMKRVQFPLPGERVTADIQDSTYQWQRTDWVMLKEFDLDSTQFKRDLSVTDTLATDEIYTPGAGFYFKMVFEPIRRKWHLVYLVDEAL